ncbi:MAG: acetyl-CoA decarbonylase/synthase complex subunit gamma [Candidatus Gastranaerophilales bacterium]|nr:acetyl-CoA decarbonylase/synthase complex subunit gamma [Candidatus Gastranaerophilales bacterium]
MELSGLQIFKYLPAGKKIQGANCKECGCPTCMAFALKVAKKQIAIDKCSKAPSELVEILESALKIQQHEIQFGVNKSLKTGGETVMFRHQKTFVNKTVFAVTLDCCDKEFFEKLKKIKNYSIDRIGELFKVDAINLIGDNDVEKCAKEVISAGFSLILNTDDEKVFNDLKNFNPIMRNSKVGDILTAKASSLDELSLASQKLIDEGKKNIILDFDISNKSLKESVEALTYIRRLAVLDKNEPFTYPVMVHIKEKNVYKTAAWAASLICRYANIIILDEFDEAMMTTLLTLRQNIYTDPQKPLQVESKVYEVNEPDENAIVMMTTNFALTYFAVLSEVESSPFSTYLVITPSDGMSVLTAWSAEKFTPEIAAKMIKNSEILKTVKNKKIIIPGLLAHLKEDLEEAIDGWDIIVGPNEAYKLPDFVKNNVM